MRNYNSLIIAKAWEWRTLRVNTGELLDLRGTGNGYLSRELKDKQELASDGEENGKSCTQEV